MTCKRCGASRIVKMDTEKESRVIVVFVLVPVLFLVLYEMTDFTIALFSGIHSKGASFAFSPYIRYHKFCNTIDKILRQVYTLSTSQLL